MRRLELTQLKLQLNTTIKMGFMQICSIYGLGYPCLYRCKIIAIALLISNFVEHHVILNVKSKLSSGQTRTVIRDNIATVINEQQLKRTQEVCTRQLFKNCSMSLRHCCYIISDDGLNLTGRKLRFQ